VLVLHASADGDATNRPPPRVPLESFVSRLGGAAGGSFGGDGSVGSGFLSVDPTDATAAVAAGVLAALTALTPAPPAPATALAAAAARASGSSAAAAGADFSWAVGYHPFPPFGLLGGPPDSRGSGSGSSGKGASSKSSSSSSGRSSPSSSSGGPGVDRANAQWALSPLYSDGAARAATAANVHAARTVSAHATDDPSVE
jgi:hypothetical protein